MYNRIITVAVLAAAPTAFAGMGATMDFEELTSGDTYGPGGTGMEMVGDDLFTDEGIVARLDDFLLTNQSVFNSNSSFIEVDGALAQTAFGSQGIEFFGSISVEFDFSGLGFNVGYVQIEWADFGGSNTLGVNGQLMGMSDFSFAPGMIDGVKIERFSRGDNAGVLAFTGDIQSITLGGQELAVDNVVARIPAPSAAGLLGCAGLAALRRRR